MRRPLTTAATLVAGLAVALGTLSAPAQAAPAQAAPGQFHAGQSHAGSGRAGQEDHPHGSARPTPAQLLHEGGALGDRPSSPQEALEVAQRISAGVAERSDPSMTLALRDLWVARPQMSGRSLSKANAILARPTDGPDDPLGSGYTEPSTRVCGEKICIHHVSVGADAPPSLEWVDHTLAVLEQTWAAEVDAMNYRAPLPDGRRGGDSRFDVYLKDLGSGLYGYCTPEKRAKGRTADGYCVLDNDYAASQFISGTPTSNLLVTAAHEFFHAVQYSYDYLEDPWMMESTATWMEERIANEVNDNRQFLSRGQLYSPGVPLDAFNQTMGYQYGNWIFWEYLSTQYGTKIVHDAWKQAGSLRKDGRRDSFGTLNRILRKRGGFAATYARFAAGNLTPAATYPEGAEYPAPGVRASATLSASNRARSKRFRVNHLSSASYRLVPEAGLGAGWKLRVEARGHRRFATVLLVVHKANGSVGLKRVPLGKRGRGAKVVPFDARRVSAVSAVVVNTSTRMRCHRGTALACAGVPLDDRLPVTVRVKALRKR